jgi:hypothetical protein
VRSQLTVSERRALRQLFSLGGTCFGAAGFICASALDAPGRTPESKRDGIPPRCYPPCRRRFRLSPPEAPFSCPPRSQARLWSMSRALLCGNARDHTPSPPPNANPPGTQPRSRTVSIAERCVSPHVVARRCKGPAGSVAAAPRGCQTGGYARDRVRVEPSQQVVLGRRKRLDGVTALAILQPAALSALWPGRHISSDCAEASMWPTE